MTSADRWLTVIGIGEDGPDGLSAVAREALAAADILVGGRRQLAMVPDDGRERIAWELPLTGTLNRIMEMAGPVAVLATGNPMVRYRRNPQSICSSSGNEGHTRTVSVFTRRRPSRLADSGGGVPHPTWPGH